ncbi:MAG TPA: protein translocase subunit SecF [Nanoarchaeota archaeon]|nr:protein translocase subunit SecF [Candidatus Woesearchaeota archaeon]HIH15506.1 protein translocase subunit SecF [Nanoarchaeota archaeon]HIH59309.1 protein translocase subunit SecF [Nanoarchaeota archaeon]HII13896.1 protein translocase subunit SecF [Nanoarchaeota archaeon]HIJ04654.1 protein translocase subunit SecF [Nanoarchaeota archaeon]
MWEKFQEFYYQHYKKLFFVPLLIVLLALGSLVYTYSTTGDIVAKDVSLKGGTTATIYSSESFPDLELKLLEKFPEGDFTVRSLEAFGSDTSLGVIIEVSTIDADALEPALEEITGLELNGENYSVEFIGGSLGASFYKQMAIALLLAYIFMGIVVFVTFRVPIPSFAVIFAAFADMICTLAVFPLFGIKLSTAGIAALLLLVGYSVDTDILLTTRLLRRHDGTLFVRLIDSMRTGLTMTAAAIVALGVGYIFSSSYVLQQMFLIILIGLVFDVIMTYGMNAGLLIWYLRKKKVEA